MTVLIVCTGRPDRGPHVWRYEPQDPPGLQRCAYCPAQRTPTPSDEDLRSRLLGDVVKAGGLDMRSTNAAFRAALAEHPGATGWALDMAVWEFLATTLERGTVKLNPRVYHEDLPAAIQLAIELLEADGYVVITAETYQQLVRRPHRGRLRRWMTRNRSAR